MKMMKKVGLSVLLASADGFASELEDQISQARQQLDEAARKLAELHKHKFSFRAREGSAKLGIMLGNISRGNISRHVPLLAQEGLAQEPGTSESRNGVELYGVTPGGGAEAAGLQAGDLITSIGATSLVDVDEPMQALVSHMKGVELGEEVMVNYLREGVSASAAITTQERSAHMATFFSDSDFDLDFDFDFDVNLDEFANGADFSAMIPSVRSSVEHSSRLMSVEGELAGYFVVDKGVLVVSAPQQDSQLKGGDIILSVGGEEIADVQQAQRHLAAIVNVADVDVMRSGQRHTISVAAGGGSMRTRSTRSESNAG
jgi:S1-C subfamily serine protease